MYIILAILIFGILIITHELGHFVAAKACGVRVLEFSVGMGPQLIGRQRGETLYSLRLFPIGGFCAMEGEDGDSDDPRSFNSQSAVKRIVILAAGAAMNFLAGFILLLIVFSRASGFSSPQISGFMDGCPYEGEQALMAGDTIYKIDGHRIYFSTNISDYMTRSDSDYHDIVVLRDGKKVRLDNFYMPLREYTRDDGTTEMKYGLYFELAPAGFASNIKYSWYCSLDFARMIWRSLGDLVGGRVGLGELSGPVGVVDAVNEAAKQESSFVDALMQVLYLFALIAVNLAIMNMLPIPALDGGRIFFLIVTLIIEKITRRKLDPKYEGWINSAAFALLMVLMVAVMFNDIIKIFVSR